MKQTDPNIIERIVEFLRDSSAYYKTSVTSRIEADRMYSGDFWTTDLITKWGRVDRACEHLSQWSVFDAAIASPISASPWHAQLEDPATNQEVQDAINAIEADSDAKNAFLECFSKGVDIGANYIVVTTIQDELTGEPKIVPECIADPSAVALDPTVVKDSARDAEQGAVVNWISVRKAKRLYGEDVIPLNFPASLPKCYDIGDQWIKRPTNSIPIVTYYEKNENGFVTMYKVCGDKVVESAELPTTFVPIFRFAGYKITRNRQIDYTGIVQKTYGLQLGLNLAYSTMLGRINRSPKANFIYPTEAVDGNEEFLRRCCEDDSMVVTFNGDVAPIPLKEAIETGDLQNVINTTQQLMAAVLGVPPTGIQGTVAGGVDVQRTATEVLEQASNRESNVACLYAHAYEAMRAVWTCVIEMLTGGERLKFSLQAGPDVITTNMKRRQELQVMAQLLPPVMQPILAKYYADTLSTDDAKMLSKDIVANMDPTLKLVSNEDLDEYAIHEIKQIKMVADQAMEQLEATQAENEQLKQQVNSMMMELSNKREQRQLDWSKAVLDHQIDQARLQLEAEKAGADASIDQQKMDIESQKLVMEAQDKMEQTIDDSNRILGGY